MSNKLTEKEFKALREYEHRCYDLMNHASISPRIFTILLDNYEQNEELKKILYRENAKKMQNINEIGV